MTDPSDEVASRGRRLRPLVLAQVASVLLVLVLFSLLVRNIMQGSSGGQFVSAIKRGEQPVAPAFDLPVIWNRPGVWPRRARPALADGRVELAELRGTPVVLNFWASWCIPCKDEAPLLAASAQAHRRAVAFLGLDIQDFSSDARRFLRRFGVPYPSVRETGDKTYRAYGLTGVPETYFIDSRGRVVAHAIGGVTRDGLERDVSLVGGKVQ